MRLPVLVGPVLLVAALTSGAGVGQAVRAQTHPAGQPPNIVVIFTDDQGYGDLGSYGHPTIRTPAIDRLAAEGQRWTSFYAAPVCTPSRAQLLTGRLAVRTGLAAGVLFPDSPGGLASSEITIAEVLKTRGYATTAIGKWHLGLSADRMPMGQGFDSYFGIPYSNDMDGVVDPTIPADAYGGRGRRFAQYMEPRRGYFNVPLMRDDRIIERPADQTTLTERYTSEAIRFVTANRHRPFFLYLAHNMPHMPLFRSKAFEGRSPRGIYGDVIEELDANVGRLVEALRDLQIDRHTLVVFTTDNGPWAPYLEQGGSAGLLRGAKASTWEGGVRVPAIFWWPGTIRPAVVTGVGSQLDLLPTLASLAGAQAPMDRPLDGVDLSNTLRSGAPSPRHTVFYYASGAGDPAPLVAVRRGAYKLHLRIPGSSATEPQSALYNLDEDPSEQFDLVKTRPEIVRALTGLAEAQRTDVAPATSQLTGRGRAAPVGRGTPPE